MGSSWLLLRAGLRGRWLGTALLVALVGLAGGVCLATWAGARRTESAYPRLLEAINAEDVTVFYDTPVPPDELEALNGAPGVRQAVAGLGYAAAPMDESGIPQLEPGIAVVASTEEGVGYEVGGLLMSEGRLPAPDASDEVAINPALRDAGYPVGSTIELCVFSFADVEQAALPEEPSGDQLRAAAQELCAFREMEVVGVGQSHGDFAVTELTSTAPFAVATPAFVATERTDPSFSFASVDLESPDDDIEAFTNWVNASDLSQTGLGSTDIKVTTVERAVDPYVRTLTIFALVAAVASLGVIGPALVRWAAPGRDETHAVRALGVTSRHARGLAVARTVLVAGFASVIAIGITVAASTMFPFGPTKEADPDPGIRIDGFVLLIGALVMVVLGVVLGLLVSTREREPVGRPSTIVRRLAALGAGPSTVIGVRNAVSGGPADTAGPLAAGAGVFAAILAVAAALTFGAGLDELLDDPDRYGWTWDALYEGYDEGLDPAVLGFLEEDDRVDGISLGFRPGVQIAGNPVPTYAFAPQQGDALPEILEGRGPEGESEVAIGGQTLDRLGLDIGDRVQLTGTEGEALEATIVGRTLLPVINLGEDVSVGEGALLDPDGAAAFGATDPEVALVDLAPGTTGDELADELVEAGLLPGGQENLVGPQLTGDLLSYSRVEGTPLLLAGLLGLLGAGVLLHTVVTAARRRRKDLAVLKALGFRRRSIGATVVWHAVTLVVACLIVGLPGGVIAGRFMWQAFARGLGVVPDPVVPLAALALTAAAAVALSVVLGVPPGQVAARRRPAPDLAAE